MSAVFVEETDSRIYSTNEGNRCTNNLYVRWNVHRHQFQQCGHIKYELV